MTKAEADKKGDGYTCPSQSKNTGDTTADCYTCEPKTCKSYNMMTEEEAKKKGDSYVCSSQSKNTGDSTTACYTCEEKTCTETCTTGSTSITCGNGYVKTEQCTDCLGKPHYTCEPKTCATYGLMTEEEAKKKGGGYTCSSQSKDTGDSTTACYACQANTCKSYSMMTKDEADKKGGGYTCSSQSKDTGDTKTACYTCEAAACTGYDLTEKPDGCTVAECLSGTTTKYMVTGAADGYEQTGDRCVAVSKSNPKPRDNCIGYDLTSEPTGCTYETCISSTNGATLYKVTGAKDGYMVSGDECVMTCETWIKANKNKTQCALIISDGREIVATDGKICPTVGINFDDTYTMSAGETLEFDDPGTYYNECSGGNVSINRINAADMSSIVTAIPLYIDDVYMGTGNDWELTCDDGAECHITSLTMQGSELTLHLSAASEFVITCEKGKGTCIINVETIGDLSPSDVALTLSTSNTSTFDDGAIRLSVNGGQNWYIYKRKIVTKGSSNINVTVN
jgi:hypothetical protein